MTKVNLTHNLNDIQLEEVLEKALKQARQYNEPNRLFPDTLSNEIRNEAEQLIDKIFDSMIKEIQDVLQQE